MDMDLNKTPEDLPSKPIIIPIRMIMPITAIGTFMSAMDGSIVNVSLVTIANALNTDMEGVRWVTIIYLLMISSLIGIGGSLGDNYGRKKIFQLGMLLFAFGSIICAFSPTLEVLVLSRALQAIGAAGLMANGLALVITYVDPSVRGRAIGINSLVVATALSTGPVLGGILTEYVGWPSIFLINVPVGLIGILLVQRFIPETTEKRVKLDYGGMITFIITTFSLVQGILTLFKGELIGVIFIVIAVISGLIFVYIENNHSTPMISVRIMQDRTILIGVISSFLCYMVYYCVVFLLPFYYQDALSFKQSQTGILMVIPPLAMAIMGPFAGFFAERIEARRSTSLGAVSLSFFVMSLAILFNIFPVGLREIVFVLVPLVAFSAGSLTTFTVSNGTSVMNAAPKSDVSIVSGLIGLSRNIGFALGTTLSSSFFTLFFTINNPDNLTSGVKYFSSYYVSLGQTFLLFSLFALISAIISYLRGSTRKKEELMT
ncbi:MAG: MFS transporter [Candidatus Heimdallarchaeota archaeon]|nr:MAG: MFS transporter [Candidatus Heimdallarchaeota archaeon]